MLKYFLYSNSFNPYKALFSQITYRKNAQFLFIALHNIPNSYLYLEWFYAFYSAALMHSDILEALLYCANRVALCFNM